jgi:F-type H+-transporting ATPase subunit gamma
VLQLLPITPEEELKMEDGRWKMEDEATEEDKNENEEEVARRIERDDLLFEPGPRNVLDELLPRMIEMRIYQALLESSSSEHAARMMAMRSATDNASSMLEDLTLTFNQARQAGITREISEISAGKAALEV